MQWNPPATVDVQDTPGELVITTTRDQRLQQKLVAAVTLCLFLAVLLFGHPTRLMQAFFGLLIVLDIVSLIRTTQIERGVVTVTTGKLEFRYSGMHTLRGSFSAAEVKEIDYKHGSESSPSGLAVRRGMLSHTCILPNVSEDEAYRLRGIIMDRFPDFNNGLATPNSVITLGLNR